LAVSSVGDPMRRQKQHGVDSAWTSLQRAMASLAPGDTFAGYQRWLSQTARMTTNRKAVEPGQDKDKMHMAFGDAIDGLHDSTHISLLDPQPGQPDAANWPLRGCRTGSRSTIARLWSSPDKQPPTHLHMPAISLIAAS